MKSNNYEWLKNSKTCWMQSSIGIPIQVEIISLDFTSEFAEIKTDYQNGKVEFSRLYKRESECPCR